MGHDVSVLTALPNYPDGDIYSGYRRGKKRDEVVNGVRIHRVPIVARGKDLCGLNKIRRIANYISFPFSSWVSRACVRDSYDVVLCVQYSPIFMAIPALRIARRQSIPCVIWCYDLWPEDMLTGGFGRSGLPYKVIHNISRKIYGAADVVATTSPGFGRYYSDQLRLENLNTVWLPQYAENIFESTGGDKEMREKSRIVVSFAGNIGGNQSVETIIRAAAQLREEDGVEIRIAGSGSRLEYCENLAKDLKATFVTFVGRLPLGDMPRFYEDSDAMLLTLAPSSNGSLVSELTIPRKFQSYLAAGKPILASVDGIVSRLIEENHCGISCSAGDPNGLAEVIKKFSSATVKTREMMANNARSLYYQRFSQQICLSNLESVLRKEVDKRRTA